MCGTQPIMSRTVCKQIDLCVSDIHDNKYSIVTEYHKYRNQLLDPIQFTKFEITQPYSKAQTSRTTCLKEVCFVMYESHRHEKGYIHFLVHQIRHIISGFRRVQLKVQIYSLTNIVGKKLPTIESLGKLYCKLDRYLWNEFERTVVVKQNRYSILRRRSTNQMQLARVQRSVQ